MLFIETHVVGAFVTEPERISDERGFFARTWCRREFEAHPSYMACGQCAFRDICPHTARNPEAET